MKPFIFSCVLLASPQASAAPAQILLTFDEELGKRKAEAVFFILTGPETLFEKRSFRRVHPKAETESGFQTVMKEIKQGCSPSAQLAEMSALHALLAAVRLAFQPLLDVSLLTTSSAARC
jgi:hypothetical protein